MPAWDRNTPWRQGHLLTPETAQHLGITHPESAEATAAIVISHDCDLAQSAANEPHVEVLVGRFVETADGNYTHAKNLRKLHLEYTQGEYRVIIELTANAKRVVAKDGEAGLASHQPSTVFQLDPPQKTILQLWLAARYRRAAFPDEFDRRLKATGMRDQLTRILKELGEHIAAIFFDVDEGKEVNRTGPDDPYMLSIYLLFSTARDPEKAEQDTIKAKAAITKAFEKRCRDETDRWQWIELLDCDVIADTVLTYAQSTELKKWQADYISLGAEPTQEILG